MELKESQKKRVCRICHQPAAAKGPLDPFVYDFGKEHAHQSCLDWEKDSKNKIEEKEKGPLTIEDLEKEISALEKCREEVKGGLYSKETILAMWNGQIKIREAFIETMKELEDELKRKDAQIIEAISILNTGTKYEKLHVVHILENGLTG